MDKDIATLLGEIKAATSWSEPQIAAKLGTSQPTVNRILNGQLDCKGSTFKAITELHASVCAPEATSEPARWETDPVPAPARAGRKPLSRDRIMTASADQPVLYERKPSAAQPKS